MKSLHKVSVASVVFLSWGLAAIAQTPGGGSGVSTVIVGGTLPTFGSTPTVNLGTIGGAATAAKQPALGIAGTSSADVITVQGRAGMTPLQVDASATAIQGTSAGIDPPAGNIVAVQGITSNVVTGSASTTGTSTTSLVPLVASKKLYITVLSCSNTGATTSLISFQNGSGGTTLWTAILPAGGGNNIASSLPLFATTAGTALFFAAGSASTTIYCSAAGFSGS